MGCKYEVRVDGDVVWTLETETYEGRNVFPAEYLAQPKAGVVELVVDDEVIGRQEPLDVDEFVAAFRRDIEGTMNVVIDDASAEVG